MENECGYLGCDSPVNEYDPVIRGQARCLSCALSWASDVVAQPKPSEPCLLAALDVFELARQFVRGQLAAIAAMRGEVPRVSR